MAGFKEGALQLKKRDSSSPSDVGTIKLYIGTSANPYMVDEYGNVIQINTTAFNLAVSGSPLALTTTGTFNVISATYSGVTSGTYGAANSIPRFVVDNYGRIISASNVGISATGSVTSVGVSSTTLTVSNSPIISAGTISINLPSLGTSGIYTKVVTDNYGRVSSGGFLTSSDIPQLPATKIGSGNISDSEFEFLDGVSANIQTQLNSINADVVVKNPTSIQTILINNGKYLVLSGSADTDAGLVLRTSAYAGVASNFVIFSDGDMSWGNGISARDTNLYRSTSGVLKTDTDFIARNISATTITVGSIDNTEFGYLNGTSANIQNQLSNLSANSSNAVIKNPVQDGNGQTIVGNFLKVSVGSGSNPAYVASVSSDSVSRFALAGSGRFDWGGGTSARDTNLYRSTSGVLKTDTDFVARNITATNFVGLASSATSAAQADKLKTARTFSISGDVTSNVPSFDGTGNVVLSATIASLPWSKISSVPTASTNTSGVLTSSDWNKFNSGVNNTSAYLPLSGGILTGNLIGTSISATNISASTISGTNITVSSFVGGKALISVGNLISESTVLSTEVDHLTNVSANIQTQINQLKQQSLSGIGGGTINRISKFVTSGSVGDSSITDNGSSVSFSTPISSNSNITAPTFTGLASLATSAYQSDKLKTARTFSISGDVTSNVPSFDGTGNVVLSANITSLPWSKISSVPTASTNTSGVLTSSDWNKFNSGVNTSAYLPLSGGTLTGNLFGTNISATNISATTINVGSVSNTEFQFLDTVSANIQDQVNQINQKLVSVISGTTNKLSKFTSTSSVGDSSITDTGSLVIFTTSVSSNSNITAPTFTGIASSATSAAQADKLKTARTFSISGDVTSNVPSFDGTGNVVLSATITSLPWSKLTSVPTASTNTSGVLTSSDWNKFNSGVNNTSAYLPLSGGTLTGNLIGTGISATNISAVTLNVGSVSNTEFQFLDTVSANIQTQLNSISAVSDHTNRAFLDSINQNLNTSSDVIFDSMSASVFEVNKTANVTVSAGQIAWNSSDATFDMGLENGVTLQLGQELHVYGRNFTSSTIPNGTAVYIISATGINGHLYFQKADNTNLAGDKVIAVTTQDIAGDSLGYATSFGVVRNLNTSALVEGAPFYLGTSGTLTSARPSWPNHSIRLGYCIDVHPTSGDIYVNIHPEQAIEEIYNVVITSATQGDSFIYENNKWINRNFGDITKDSTGFKNPESVVVTYDETTRKVTLTGLVEAYWRSNNVSALVPGWVSDAHPTNVSATQFLYYNGSSFVWSSVPWTFDMLQIAAVIYGQDGKYYFTLRETHGLMQHQVHQEFHLNIGTYLISGGDISSYVLNSTTVADRRPDVASMKLGDEDLETVLTSLTTKSYTLFNLSGSTRGNFTSASAEIVPVSTNRPYYNEWTGAVWQQTLMPNNDYAAVFVMAVPVGSDTKSQNRRFLFIQPQTSNASLSTIQALQPADLNLNDLTYSPEYNFFGKIIIRYTGGNWVLISVEKLSTSKAFQSSTGAGYLSTVNIGAALSGSGTAGSPLNLINGKTPGTYTKVVSNEYGIVTSGGYISASDMPFGISAENIGNGTVSTTEFQYINSLSANAQSQINYLSGIAFHTNRSNLNSINQNLSTTSPVVFSTVSATTLTGTLIGLASSATSAAQSDKLKTARTFSISGDVNSNVQSFDGTSNVVLSATIPSLPWAKITSVPTASASTSGVLTSSDWNKFNTGINRTSAYLPLSGGTLTGNLFGTNISANNISAVSTHLGGYNDVTYKPITMRVEGGISSLWPNVLTIQSEDSVFTRAQLQSPIIADITTGNFESTFSLLRYAVDGSSESLDLYNNGYSTDRSMGLIIQKRGNGVLRPFKFLTFDNVTKITAATIQPSTSTWEFNYLISATGGVRLSTLSTDKVVVSDSSRNLISSNISTNTLNYLSAVSADIQSQLNSKVTTTTAITSAWSITNSTNQQSLTIVHNFNTVFPIVMVRNTDTGNIINGYELNTSLNSITIKIMSFKNMNLVVYVTKL